MTATPAWTLLIRFQGNRFDTVPSASVEDVVLSARAAEDGRDQMARLTGMDRYEILMRAVGVMESRKEELGQTITREEGKVISEGRLEVDRANSDDDVVG